MTNKCNEIFVSNLPPAICTIEPLPVCPVAARNQERWIATFGPPLASDTAIMGLYFPVDSISRDSCTQFNFELVRQYETPIPNAIFVRLHFNPVSPEQHSAAVQTAYIMLG